MQSDQWLERSGRQKELEEKERYSGVTKKGEEVGKSVTSKPVVAADAERADETVDVHWLRRRETRRYAQKI